MNTIAVLMLAIFFIPRLSLAQEGELEAEQTMLGKSIDETKEEKINLSAKTVDGSDSAKVDRNLDLRDPFKRRKRRRRGTIQSYKTIMVNNSYSNVPVMGKVPIDSIKIVGIILGKKRLAQAKVDSDSGKGGEIYDLREGMKIGDSNSKVEAILPGGVVVVERVKSIYNEDEFIETIIPLTGEI